MNTTKTISQIEINKTVIQSYFEAYNNKNEAIFNEIPEYIDHGQSAAYMGSPGIGVAGAKHDLKNSVDNKNSVDKLDEARAIIMDNMKSLGGELASVWSSLDFTREDAQRVAVPTLLVKGERSPKFLHDIIDILASCLPNNEQTTIPEESHDLRRMKKPEVSNTTVLKFLSKYS